jgi:chromate reductase
MKILVIGGSNSKNSINRALAQHATTYLNHSMSELVDISKIDLPIYSLDKEAENGIPNAILDFANKIDTSDFIVISLAENNGSFNVGLKNLLDWTSRIKERKTFNNKPMLLMATSPGARGGQSVLDSAKALFPYWGADIKGTFSLPNFYQNFDFEKGIVNDEYKVLLTEVIENIK